MENKALAFPVITYINKRKASIMLELTQGKSMISMTFSSWLISHNGVTFQNPVFKISQCCPSSSDAEVIERQERYLFERASVLFWGLLFCVKILKEQPRRLIYNSNPNKDAQMNCQHFHILCGSFCLSVLHYSSVCALSFGNRLGLIQRM